MRGPTGSLNAMPKRRFSRSPIGHLHGTTRWLLTMSCQRHCSINPRSVDRIHAILLLRRRAGLPCRKVRLQIRRRFPRTARDRLPCCLLAHRLGERPISISLGSLVSHRHVGSRMTETSHQFFGRCALPGGERGGHTSKHMKGEAFQTEGRDGWPPNISTEIGRGRNAASRSHEEQTVRPCSENRSR